MPGRLEGKVAVITGGTSGLGLATAERFIAEGAYVFITGCEQGVFPLERQGNIADLEEERRLMYVDITRAKQLLGWEPAVNREAGLKRTLEYFRKKLGK